MNRGLARLRDRIDRLDRVLVRRLAERQRLVEAVARTKADPGRARDTDRMVAVMTHVLRNAAEQGLSPDIAEPVWRVLMDRCAAHEMAILTRTVGPPSGDPGPDNECCGCKDSIPVMQSPGDGKESSVS